MKFPRFFAVFFFGLVIAGLSARATIITWSPFPTSPAYVGQSLDFGFSAEDVFGGGEDSEYIIVYGTDKIDFGDGAFVLGGYGSHTYLTAGVYTVTAFYSGFAFAPGGAAYRSLEILAVPDSGATVALIGFALAGLCALRRKFSTN